MSGCPEQRMSEGVPAASRSIGTEKRCTKCGKRKPIDDFHVRKTSPDGRKSWCKKCCRTYQHKWYGQNEEAVSLYNSKYKERNRELILSSQREYKEKKREDIRIQRREYRERNQKEERMRQRKWRKKNHEFVLSYQRKWRKENREKVSSYNCKYHAKNHEKARAHGAVYRALKRGDLVKGCCEICGATKNIDAHHEDYSEPLRVKWLCKKHHRRLHAEKILAVS